MNITFYNANSDTTCLVVCNNQLHLPIIYNCSDIMQINIMWIENSGTCSVTIDTPTTANTGYYCCTVASEMNPLSQVIECDSILVIGAGEITDNPTKHSSNEYNILIEGAGGVVSLLLLAVVVIVITYFIWRARHRNYHQSMHYVVLYYNNMYVSNVHVYMYIRIYMWCYILQYKVVVAMDVRMVGHRQCSLSKASMWLYRSMYIYDIFVHI